MKIGKYIIEIVPNNSIEHNLSGLPYTRIITYKLNIKHIKCKIINLINIHAIICKHIKPNTGIRYSILGKYWIFLVIKQLN